MGFPILCETKLVKWAVTRIYREKSQIRSIQLRRFNNFQAFSNEFHKNWFEHGYFQRQRRIFGFIDNIENTSNVRITQGSSNSFIMLCKKIDEYKTMFQTLKLR